MTPSQAWVYVGAIHLPSFRMIQMQKYDVARAVTKKLETQFPVSPEGELFFSIIVKT